VFVGRVGNAPIGLFNEYMARQHGSKQIKKFLTEIQRLGFNVENLNNRYRITPPKHLGNRIYFTHGTPKALKPLCADFQKIYGVELDWRQFA
jgi:hypothetical protein